MFSLKTQNVPRKAIAYYRHSAEDKQEFSVPIQRERVEKFAAENNIEIIHEEADEGKSGLDANRPGFQRLLNDWIRNKSAPSFKYILVLDVSRWGRFQDLDAPGHYTFECTQNGKELVFVTRGFTNEGDRLGSSAVTLMERFEAARFSERLSEKVFFGSMNISKQGYSVGGTACYGMSRLLLDEHKQPMGILKKGQHKAISNARITFVPAGDETTEVVREIFNAYANTWDSTTVISDRLNERGIISPGGKLWTKDSVIRILRNEIYIGTRIYNRTWSKLKRGHRSNPRNEWVIIPDAFPLTVEKEIFYKGQERLFFSSPSQWKNGIRKTKRAQVLLKKELVKLLENNGIHNNDIEQIKKNFPVLFSVPFSLSSTATRWCFLIPTIMRRYPAVLGIGVNTESRDPVDKLFLIPTNEFAAEDYRVFSDKDGAYKNYYVKEEEIEDKIKDIIQTLNIN